MKRAILRIDDANMAGFEWSYTFWLGRARDRTLTLSLRQSAAGELRRDVGPAKSLRTGVDVYQALGGMLDDLGYYVGGIDTEAVAHEIEQFDPAVAAQFRVATAP